VKTFTAGWCCEDLHSGIYRTRPFWEPLGLWPLCASNQGPRRTIRLWSEFELPICPLHRFSPRPIPWRCCVPVLLGPTRVHRPPFHVWRSLVLKSLAERSFSADAPTLLLRRLVLVCAHARTATTCSICPSVLRTNTMDCPPPPPRAAVAPVRALVLQFGAAVYH